MPKFIDYPRAPLKASLELAATVDDLGGSSSIEMAADKLGKKVSGAFQAQIASSAKYGLITAKSQRLSTTALFREIKLAYTEAERQEKLRVAFLSVPVFRDVYQRFAGKELPTAHFEKLLIREFGIPEDWGSRIASYFLDGAKASGLWGDGNRLIDVAKPNALSNAIEDDNSLSLSAAPEPNREVISLIPDKMESSGGKYIVKILGPRLNSSIEINELDDLEIVNVMLRKVAKALTESR